MGSLMAGWDSPTSDPKLGNIFLTSSILVDHVKSQFTVSG